MGLVLLMIEGEVISEVGREEMLEGVGRRGKRDVIKALIDGSLFADFRASGVNKMRSQQRLFLI